MNKKLNKKDLMNIQGGRRSPVSSFWQELGNSAWDQITRHMHL